MATNNDDIASLRAEARRRHKAANAKVSRLRAQGVELGGTKFDVRRDASAIKKYNKAQLNAYIRRLNTFTSRATGFVAGDMKTPLPRAKWERYQRAESRANAIGRQDESTVEGTPLPNGGTIGGRKTKLANRATGNAVNSPYGQINRKSTNITNEAALDALTKQMEAKTKKGYLPEKLKAGRWQAMEMLKEVGAPLEQMERLNKLSDHQFHVMWNHTAAATEISSWYERAKLAARGEKERADEKVTQDNRLAIDDLLQWAELLPVTAPGKPAVKKPRRK